METTGERFIPDAGMNTALEIEHMHRYAAVAPLLVGKTVLDAACGVGYGSQLIAKYAAQVTGVDIDAKTVTYAQTHYAARNLTFAQASIGDLPFAAASFDAVVSFETIEHVDEAMQRLFLAQIARLLKPNGVLVISTPDREILLQKSHGRYHNPFHIKEYSRGDFLALLHEYFPQVTMHAQQRINCSVIDGAGGVSYNQTKPMEGSDYMIAVCSARPVSMDLGSTYVPTEQAWQELLHSCFYLDDGTGYSEERREDAFNVPRLNGDFSVKLTLADTVGLHKIRFDPCDFPAWITLHAVDADGRELVLEPLNRSLVVDGVDGFMHGDPCYEWDIPVGQGGVVLAVQGNCEACTQVEIDKFWAEHTEQALAECNAVQSLLRKSRAALSEKERELTTAGEKLVAVERQRLDELAAVREQHRVEFAAAEAAHANVLVASEQQHLARETALQAENAEIARQLATTLTRALIAEEEYHVIATSRCWRMTLPLRKVLDGFKKLIWRPCEAVGKTVRYCKAFGFFATLKKVRGKLFPVVAYDTRHPLQFPNELALESEIVTSNVTVTVVVPTKNGGTTYELFLKNVLNQQGFASVNMVVVDSGSSDRTVELSRSYGATVIEIKPEEFSHSYARNLGAEHADGDYLVFMTQDALPTSDKWLFHIYTFLKTHEKVAAVSCVEYAKQDSDLYHRAFAWNHYSYLGAQEHDQIMRKPAEATPETIRQNGQLSDITCLIKRERFLQYRYRGGFAEDLDLGMRLIEDGFELGFLSSEAVIHSHNRDAYYYLRRRFVELLTLKRVIPETPVTPYSMAQVIRETLFLACKLQRICTQLADQMHTMPLEEFKNVFLEKYRAVRGDFLPTVEIARVLCGMLPVDRKTKAFFDFCAEEYAQGLYTPDCKYSGDFLSALEGYILVVFRYMENCYELVDADLLSDFVDCLYKMLTSVVGTYLAFSHHASEGDRVKYEKLFQEIGAGV